MRVFRLMGAMVAFLGVAVAQQSGPSLNAERVTMTGQVYAPNGDPMRQSVHIQWQSEEGIRHAEDLYTDSTGGFTLLVIPEVRYTFTVLSDGEQWADTSVSFIPPRIHPTLEINLRALPRPSIAPGPPSVSVSRLKEKVPAEARQKFDEGVKRLREGKGDLGRSKFERAIEIFPDYLDARNELAVALLRQNKLQEAQEQLQRALAIDADAVGPRYNLALCLYRQGRFAEAVPHLQKALQLRPGEPRMLLLLGISLARSAQVEAAEPALLLDYERGGKDAADAQFYLAHIYADRKDYPRAIRALEIYLRDKPDSPDAPQLREILGRLRAAAPPP